MTNWSFFFVFCQKGFLVPIWTGQSTVQLNNIIFIYDCISRRLAAPHTDADRYQTRWRSYLQGELGLNSNLFYEILKIFSHFLTMMDTTWCWQSKGHRFKPRSTLSPTENTRTFRCHGIQFGQSGDDSVFLAERRITLPKSPRVLCGTEQIANEGTHLYN